MPERSSARVIPNRRTRDAQYRRDERPDGPRSGCCCRWVGGTGGNVRGKNSSHLEPLVRNGDATYRWRAGARLPPSPVVPRRCPRAKAANVEATMETSMIECASESVATLNEEELDIVVGGQGAWEAAKEKV